MDQKEVEMQKEQTCEVVVNAVRKSKMMTRSQYRASRSSVATDVQSKDSATVEQPNPEMIDCTAALEAKANSSDQPLVGDASAEDVVNDSAPVIVTVSEDSTKDESKHEVAAEALKDAEVVGTEAKQEAASEVQISAQAEQAPAQEEQVVLEGTMPQAPNEEQKSQPASKKRGWAEHSRLVEPVVPCAEST